MIMHGATPSTTRQVEDQMAQRAEADASVGVVAEPVAEAESSTDPVIGV